MGPTVADLMAKIIDRIDDRPSGPGRPLLPTAEVIETHCFFLREGVQWRELRAADGCASGSTLHRRLEEGHMTAVLRPCPCRPRPYGALRSRRRHLGRRGGQLLGMGQARWRPDRAEPDRPRQTGHQVPRAVSTDGLPLAVLPSPATVHDTKLFPDLLRLAQVVCTTISRLYADTRLRQRRYPLALLTSGSTTVKRQDRSGRSILALLTAAAIVIIANRLTAF